MQMRNLSALKDLDREVGIDHTDHTDHKIIQIIQIIQIICPMCELFL